MPRSILSGNILSEPDLEELYRLLAVWTTNEELAVWAANEFNERHETRIKGKMTIDFNAREIRISLKPVGRPCGRKVLEASVFPEYAENATMRFVQELCGLIGGDTVYLETLSKEGVRYQTVPVSGWLDPNVRASAATASTFVKRALETNLRLEAFGSDRLRYAVSVTCSNRTHDLIDNGSDSIGAHAETAQPDTEPNGIRSTF